MKKLRQRVFKSQSILLSILTIFMSVGTFFMILQKTEAAFDIDYGWTNSIGSTAPDYGRDIAVGSDGSMYVVGDFSGTVDFDPTGGIDSKTSNGSTDIFITKYNSDGTYVWTRTAGGTGADAMYAIEVASDGAVLAAGYFAGTADLDGTGGIDSHTASGFQDAFITKYDSGGNYVWSRVMGGAGGIVSSDDIVLSSSGDVYLTGWFTLATIDFDGTAGTDNHSINGGTDIYLVKYDNNGNYGWAKTVGSSSSDYGRGIAFTTDDFVYISGEFTGTVDFDPTGTVDNHVGNGSTDIFVSKYDTTGNYIYTRTVGGSSSDYGRGIDVASDGSIHFTGYFSGTVDFDPSGGTDNHTSTANWDGFTSKYDEDGNYTWTRTFGGNLEDYGMEVSVGSSDEVYIGGFFKSTSVDFDGTAGIDNHSNTSSGTSDMYITKYYSDGSYDWTRTYGSSSNDFIQSIHAGSDGSIFTTGYFSNTVDFDIVSGTDNHTSGGGYDFFISKYNGPSYAAINLPGTLALSNTAETVDFVNDTSGINGSYSARLASSGGTPISDFTLDLTADVDFTGVTSDTNIASGKAFVSGLNDTNIPEMSNTHSLYIPKLAGQTSTYICPDATQMSEVFVGCSNGYTLIFGTASNLSIVNISGQDYWRVTGLTGTGGLGTYTSASVLTLTPNVGTDSVAQDVDASYTSGGTFVSGDKVIITLDSGLTGANTCATQTTDADGIGGADGAGVISGGGSIYTYTFTGSSAAAVTFCIDLTGVGGNYAVHLNDDNGTYGTTLYYIQPDGNEMNVLANVAPSLSFNIQDIDDTGDLNICNFGTISTSTALPNTNGTVDAGECGYSLAIGTNSASGFQAQITSDGALRTATTNMNNIADDAAWSSGVEAYGIAEIVPATTGRNGGTGDYDQSIIEDSIGNDYSVDTSPIPTVAENFISYTDGVQYAEAGGSTDVTKVIHGLVVGAGTPAGSYAQVVTYTVTASF